MHRIRKRHDPSQVFIGLYRVDIFDFLLLRRPDFYGASVYPEWVELVKHWFLEVPPPPVFSYYSGRIYEYGFCRLIFSTDQSVFAVRAVAHCFRVVSSGATHVFQIDDCIHSKTSFWLHCHQS